MKTIKIARFYGSYARDDEFEKVFYYLQVKIQAQTQIHLPIPNRILHSLCIDELFFFTLLIDYEEIEICAVTYFRLLYTGYRVGLLPTIKSECFH